MSSFTPKELEYLAEQRLGRLATINEEGRPQIAPVTFQYNPEFDAIEIGGRNLRQSKKFRNILQNPYVSFVVDDVLPPWNARGVEIRGTAQGLGEENAIIRVTPEQIIGWGIDGGSYQQHNRRVSGS